MRETFDAIDALEDATPLEKARAKLKGIVQFSQQLKPLVDLPFQCEWWDPDEIVELMTDSHFRSYLWPKHDA